MQNQTKIKVLAATLTASLSFAAYKASWEGERLKPYRDSGGVPTIGIGTTQYPPDYLGGRKVRITDPSITPAQSKAFAAWHSQKDAEFLRNSLPNVLLSQDEFDIYLDFTYQFGRKAWQGSSMRQHLLSTTHTINPVVKRQAYRNACYALQRWRKVRINGVLTDCSARNSGCYGVWRRQQSRMEVCLNANP